ncbi:MAG: B12-binding domain-containing radical SAM protein, partial [Anaerohalosphaera sp.]|nr:B12-binding domain-containing radical SAM protein [Anaerohalosphaera sp.]
MNSKNIRILEKQVSEKFLPFVRKPSRYIGGEVNQTKKDLTSCEVTVALCFPDIYEIAMSHTGLTILYHILNQIPDVAAERLFCPWSDAEELLRKEQIPLFTLESKAAAADMDIIGISISNELCYSNVLNILDLAGVPLRSADRTDDHPLIIAGGQMSNSCEPIADFIDMFVLGDGEEAAVDIVNLVRNQKHTGATRKEILLTAAKTMPHVYVPALYTQSYDNDKNSSITPLDSSIPTQFKNATVKDFDMAPLPDKPIVPFAPAVHERVSIEIMRGCPGRCRFCQASFCKRPIRF